MQSATTGGCSAFDRVRPLFPSLGTVTSRSRLLAARPSARRAPPLPPLPAPQEEDFEEGELEEVELVALAFDISVEKLPQGVTTAAQLCAHVSEIIRKAAPNIPSDKTLEDMGVAENALLVVASTDNDDDPFQPQDDVRPALCLSPSSASPSARRPAAPEPAPWPLRADTVSKYDSLSLPPPAQSIFAEILFLDENDATIALDKVVRQRAAAATPSSGWRRSLSLRHHGAPSPGPGEQIQALEVRGFKAELAEYDDVRSPDSPDSICPAPRQPRPNHRPQQAEACPGAAGRDV